MKVSLVSVTNSCVQGPSDKFLTAEELVVYIARVSNPSNQMNMETAPKLLRYLIDKKHWSPFEMVDMTVEIKTSRAIAQQILRHRSFSFQEFSQRYAAATEFEPIELRRQSKKNRQSSTDIIDDEAVIDSINKHNAQTEKLYKYLISCDVAKETARFILPLTTQTTIYMKGSLRSWLTYFNLRLNEHTQKEHRLVAEEIRDIFIQQFPDISSAFDNFKDAYQKHFI